MKIQCPNCKEPLNIGRLIGQIKSEKKSEQSRKNGKKGGRPKKPKAE